MPRLSRFFIRAALIYLLLGFTIGSLILAGKGVPFMPLVWSLLPVHIEFLILGWLTQLALGVAFWILPRFASAQPRGNERWSWAAFFLLNMGIALYSVSVYANPTGLGTGARFLELLGFLAYLIGNWRRVYPLKFTEFPSR